MRMAAYPQMSTKKGIEIFHRISFKKPIIMKSDLPAVEIDKMIRLVGDMGAEVAA